MTKCKALNRYYVFLRYSYPDWNRVGSTAKQPCFKDAIVHSYRPVGVVVAGGAIAPHLVHPYINQEGHIIPTTLLPIDHLPPDFETFLRP